MKKHSKDEKLSIALNNIIKNKKFDKNSLETIKKICSEIEEYDETILEEAQRIVYGARNDSYGKVSTNFKRIGTMWSAIIDAPVTPEQVGLCMMALKISRQCHKPSRDNLVDCAGYAATLEKMSKEA